MATGKIKYINKYRRHGDMVAVSETIGCSASTVDKILRGSRTPDTTLGNKILAAMEDLINARNKHLKKSRRVKS